MASILDGLNAAQKSAVTSDANVVQILAPPGSGKTKTLTTRLAYLLQHHGHKPWNVICLTFTIKSAREMRDRVSMLLGSGIEKRVVLGTFHSICRRYLVAYGHLVNLRKGFGIADSSDTISIIKRIIKRRKLNAEPQKAQACISQWKSKGLRIEDVEQQLLVNKNVEKREMVTVWDDYRSQLEASNLLDYDDLLIRCLDLLEQHPECVSNVEAVLIDEFQDTNRVQFDLMVLFANKNKRVTTVGDMDQSIYGWRNAEIQNLERMRWLYPDTLVINLQENYRSSGAILHIANEVIEQDTSRAQKSMVPTHCPGLSPVLRRLPSSAVEADWIVTELIRARALTGNLLRHSDFAILLRSASLSRLIETKLGRAGIPYRMFGGHRFYDRAEIKILLDHLRVIIQPSNNDAITRVINVPPRGVGDTTVKRLLESAEMCDPDKTKKSLWDSLSMVLQGFSVRDAHVTKNALTGIGTFVRLISTCRQRMMSSINPASPEDLLRCVISKLDLKAYLEKNYQDDHESRWQNVEELVSQASDYHIREPEADEAYGQVPDALPDIAEVEQSAANGAQEALSNFLANVALTSEVQQNEGEGGEPPQDQVTISTIHAAKGLEWPVVFVPSAYDGCIPHSRAEDTDEERRLLYVAMTRAQALLYLSCPVSNSKREETTLSQFLSERKVLKAFCSQGPVLGAMEVNDVARILSRPCPSNTDIADACCHLENLEDNRWNLDGSESTEVIQARMAGWGRDGSTSENSSRSKRRKIEHDPSQMVPISMGYKTTMDATQAFTVNANAGFTTASAHLKAMPTTAASTVAHENDKGKQKQQKPKAAKSDSNQASLSALWGSRPASQKVPQTNADQAAAHHTVQTHVKLHFTTIEPAQDQPSRDPLLPIKPGLTNRRIQPNALSSRPIMESAEGTKGYVFLSSDDPPEHAETMEKPSVPAGPPPDMNKPRKTLGVTRRVGEWKSGGRHAFSVPTMKNRP